MFDSNEIYLGLNSDFDGSNDNPEFMPLFSKQDEEEFRNMELPEEVPVLAIRNTVLFPGVIFPITLGRDKSIKLVREAAKKDKIIAVVAQKNPEIEDPAQEDLFTV
ncbi:MAG: LON peptidase substrate-binding domain-containing protein, partial [Sphingomonadales bacterium]